MKRRTENRLMYDRHTINAAMTDTWSRPKQMPTGFWKTLGEILMTAAIIGAVVGTVLALIFRYPHA